MNANEVALMLRERQERYGSERMRLEVRGGVPGLRLTAVDGRSASVSSPGSGWVCLELDSGFSREHFEDEIADADLEDLVDEFIRLGLHYLDHGGVIIPSALRGFERMAIGPPDIAMVLHRSLGSSLRILFAGSH